MSFRLFSPRLKCIYVEIRSFQRQRSPRSPLYVVLMRRSRDIPRLFRKGIRKTNDVDVDERFEPRSAKPTKAAITCYNGTSTEIARWSGWSWVLSFVGSSNFIVLVSYSIEFRTMQTTKNTNAPSLNCKDTNTARH